ncbi:MAG: ferrous iron transport protein A [Clostridium butyricum]|nr:ferrous iron transport protein A [Clostridium butyricum]
MNNKKTNYITTLNNINLDTECYVKNINAEGPIQRRFLDLGLINGTTILPISKSPSGDPIAYLIRGTVIAIRSEDASKIVVETVQN